MTNVQIIMNNALALMEAGVIGTTGRELVVEMPDGSKKVYQEPEELHTFQGWKERGYKVKKGEHAVARFSIWKHVAGKTEEQDGEDKPSRMFLKNSCWFSAAQVEKAGA